MSLQYSTIDVPSRFGVTIHHRFATHDPRSDKLLIMLPGRGYTCDYPLLYYLRSAALQAGYDVLSVQYGFQAANLDLPSGESGSLKQDVQGAVYPALERGYRQVCIAGKSLGTPLAAELALTLPSGSVRLLQLTPIGGAFEGIETIPTLAIIGTADQVYSPALVASFDGHPAVRWRVFDGLNHSLEPKGDWRGALAVMSEIIAACEAFLTE